MQIFYRSFCVAWNWLGFMYIKYKQRSFLFAHSKRLVIYLDSFLNEGEFKINKTILQFSSIA
jgi:hypothetical protein